VKTQSRGAKAKPNIAHVTARFVAEMQDLLEIQLREALIAAISEGSTPGVGKRGGAGTAASAPGRKHRGAGGLAVESKTSASHAAGRAPRVRRSAADLDAVKQRLLETIALNPKLSSEELSERLGIPTKSLRGPLQLLRDEHKVRTTGQRRDMRYFASAS
jgi:hypothetical protein